MRSEGRLLELSFKSSISHIPVYISFNFRKRLNKQREKNKTQKITVSLFLTFIKMHDNIGFMG